MFKIDARSSQIGTPGPPKSVPEAPRGTQIRFWEHLEQQVGLPWPIWAAIGTLGGPIWAFLGLNLELRGFICWPDGPFWVPRASILRFPGHPEAAFCQFYSKFAKFMKTIEKPRFSYGFSMISGVRRASKSTKNLKKSSPECLGTLKNRLRWAGLAGLAAQVANVGPMGAQRWPKWFSQGATR